MLVSLKLLQISLTSHTTSRTRIFDTTVTLGNIGTVVGTVAVILGFLHRYDKKVDSRHEDNVNKFNNTTDTLQRIEIKLGDNTRTTNEINLKMEKHISNDDAKHVEFDRRLDRLEE